MVRALDSLPGPHYLDTPYGDKREAQNSQGSNISREEKLCETGTKLKGRFKLRAGGFSSTNSIRNNHLEVRSLGFGFGLIIKAKFLSLSGL